MDARQSTPQETAGRRAVFARNMAGLYAIRLTSLLPLVYIPYVVRIIGPAGYGVFAFAQSLISYFSMLIDYGFNMAGTRRIAANRSNREARDRVVSATLAAKLLLATAGLFVLGALMLTVPPIRAAWYVILPLYGHVFGYALFPYWLYQGEERMLPSSLLMVSGNVIATVLVFFVVNDAGDYAALAMLWGSASMVLGSVALIFGLRLFRVRLNVPTRSEVLDTLKDGMLLSMSAGSTTLYTSGNAFVLGLVAPREVVGLYSAGEKIVRGVQELAAPLQQALYPRAARLAGESRDGALRAARRVIAVAGILGFTLSATLFLTAPLLVGFILGPDFVRTVAVIQLLSPLPLLVALSSSLTFQVMLPFGRDGVLLRLITLAGVTNIALAFLLGPRLLELGMAAAVLTAEIIVLASVTQYLRSTGLNLMRSGKRDVAASRLIGAVVDD